MCEHCRMSKDPKNVGKLDYFQKSDGGDLNQNRRTGNTGSAAGGCCSWRSTCCGNGCCNTIPDCCTQGQAVDTTRKKSVELNGSLDYRLAMGYDPLPTGYGMPGSALHKLRNNRIPCVTSTIESPKCYGGECGGSASASSSKSAVLEIRESER